MTVESYGQELGRQSTRYNIYVGALQGRAAMPVDRHTESVASSSRSYGLESSQAMAVVAVVVEAAVAEVVVVGAVVVDVAVVVAIAAVVEQLACNQ